MNVTGVTAASEPYNEVEDIVASPESVPELNISRTPIVKKKMFLLTVGREPFLNYLRNLSIQVLIFAFTLIAALKLDFTVWDLSNAPMTVVFYTLVVTFIFAAWANCSLLLNKWSDHYGDSRKRNPVAFAELIFIFLVFTVALAIVWASAIKQAEPFFTSKSSHIPQKEVDAGARN